MKLNADQRAEFDREGYLFFPGLFTPEEANLLKAEADNVYALQREEVWRETSGVARTAFAAAKAVRATPDVSRHTSSR